MWYTISLIFGIALVVISLYTIIETLTFLKKGENTLATIIAIEVTKDSDGDFSYKPIFRFTTKSNREITYDKGSSDTASEYWVGKKVSIVYDPFDPDDKLHVSYFGLFNIPLVLLIIGCPLLVYSGGYYLTKSLIEQFTINM